MASTGRIGRALRLAAVGIIVAGLAGCTVSEPPGTPAPAAAWSYHGADGPVHWGDIAPACADTQTARQSPVDIVTAQLEHEIGASPVQTDYRAARFAVENTGHAIEAAPSDRDAGSIGVDGTSYRLQQFHFHTSSEHTVDGVHAAAELHLVHASDAGEVAVFAVLLAEGDGNPALGELFDALASAPGDGDEAPLVSPIDPTALLPESRHAARYTGSLTTPPCTEGVSWTVFLSPVTVSPAQLTALRSAFPDNHRPLQPLNGRPLSAVGGA